MKVTCIQANLGDTKECVRLAEEAEEWSPTGGMDILISNAGKGNLTNWLDVRSVEGWR